MTVQEIESAVLKQLPFRKKEALLNREFAKKDIFKDAGMIIISGLSSIYINDARKAITGYYDINSKKYEENVRAFNKHIGRVAEVMRCYGVKPEEPDFYRKFSEAFWIKHNTKTAGDMFKSGVILSHVLSYNNTNNNNSFWDSLNEESFFRKSDFVSFFIYNKTNLTKNYLFLSKTKEKKYVDFLNFAY